MRNGLGIRSEQGSEMVLECDQECPGNEAATTFNPAETRKSTSTDFTFVWPDLKSSPPRNTPCCSASSTTPGTKVFWGEPLMYVHCVCVCVCVCVCMRACVHVHVCVCVERWWSSEIEASKVCNCAICIKE